MTRHRALAALAVFLLTAGSAAADTVVSATVGRTFGGDVEDGHIGYGAAIGFGGGLLGFEVEGIYTPHFFGNTPNGTNNVTTLMGNIVLGVPIGHAAHLYASGGAGLMKFRVPDIDQFFDINRNDFGVDAGAGAIVYFGKTVGLRGDVRYFRDVHESTTGDFDVDLGGFNFWRGSLGLSFRF
jgi:hypothetical protein